MKVITLAMLNRFWKNGILAELAKKADKKEIENIKAEFDNVNSDLSRKLDNSAVGADSLLSKITTSWVDTPTDDTYFIRQNTGGKSTFGRVKFSTLWSYIKGKADKVYAALTHTHTKSQITDFPTSMPANGGNSTTVNSHTVNSNVPANAKFTDTVYTHPTNSGYKHIPSGGSDGQILKWSSDGTAKWSDNILVDSEINNTSTNPVQNKVVAAALDGKMPVYSYNGGTFDADDLTSPAIHLINSGGTNLPASCSGGVLLVDGSSQTTQYFFPLYNGDNRIHTRYKYHGTEWTDWEILGLSTSQSTAITTAGTYALDAVQNNASVSGTLANKIKNLSANCPQFISDYKKTLIKNVSAKSYTATEDCMVRCDLVTSGTAFEIMNIKINDIMVYVYQNPTSQASVQSTTSYILKKGDVIKISAVSSTMHVYVKN